MELNLIEQGKNRIVFELPGTSHTFCNLLKKELLNDSHIKIATYSLKHPLISAPRFIVETDGEDFKKVLTAASSRIQKMNAKFLESFKKEVK